MRVPGERGRRGPWTELAGQLVIENFECVPGHTPRSRPSLNPSFGQDAALCRVRDGVPVGVEELALRARGLDLPH